MTVHTELWPCTPSYDRAHRARAQPLCGAKNKALLHAVTRRARAWCRSVIKFPIRQAGEEFVLGGDTTGHDLGDLMSNAKATSLQSPGGGSAAVHLEKPVGEAAGPTAVPEGAAPHSHSRSRSYGRSCGHTHTHTHSRSHSHNRSSRSRSRSRSHSLATKALQPRSLL